MARNAVRLASLWSPRSGGGGSVGTARPLASAAIRIPEKVAERLALVFPSPSPSLYVHEGARQALERRLMATHPGQVVLSITDNRQSIISHSKRSGVLRVRLHHMFLDAPPKVMEALVRYITRGDREASVRVGLYIDENGYRLARRRHRTVPLHTKGKRHDLLAIFGDLAARYFGGAVSARITWGNKVPRRTPRSASAAPRKVIRLGSYNAHERVIRIHPALDRSWVPRYFVAFVVYHEILHHLYPPARHEGGRRVLHPPVFVAKEREFRNFERAIGWELRNTARLLRVA